MTTTKNRTQTADIEPASGVDRPLADQLSELSSEISKTESEIEGIVRIIQNTPNRLAQAKIDYDRAFIESNDAETKAAQATIREANEQRAAAVAKLGDYAELLERLRHRQSDLRQRITAASAMAKNDYESAYRQMVECSRYIDITGDMWARLSAMRSTLEASA